VSTLADPARTGQASSPQRGDLAGEYRRLLEVGVNPRAAETIVCNLRARAERELAEATRAYAQVRAVRVKRAVNSRRKPCTRCPRTVRADSYARHLRTHPDDATRVA
jgi:hypothetical protein